MGNWVFQELSYDRHFPDNERIYRVSVSFYNSGAFASGPEVLNSTLDEIAPEVELTTRLDRTSPTPVSVNNFESFEETLFYADSNFLAINISHSG